MPHKFGINSPPSVKHISRKAFFKHALGDCIISLEALQTTEKKVCTTNVKDFKPICNYIGVEICEVKT